VRKVTREFEQRSGQLEQQLREAVLTKLRYARRLRRLYGERPDAGIRDAD
jgi:hypothetical protein